MKREEALRLLREHQAELAKSHVKSLAVFGSVARDEAQQDSDVDVLVEFSEPVGMFHFMGMKRQLELLLGTSVDLATPDVIRESMREQIFREAIYASIPLRYKR